MLIKIISEFRKCVMKKGLNLTDEAAHLKGLLITVGLLVTGLILTTTKDQNRRSCS